MTWQVGVIGAGTHGVRYLRHLARDVESLEPVALCRRDRQVGEGLAGELGCRYHARPADLIADPQVQTVIVCTPPSSHFGLAEMTLAAGKPLLLEKPLTGTLAEARRLARLAAESGAPPLLLAQTERWNATVREARALWPALGRVHHLRLSQRLAPTRLTWQRDPEISVGGSVLLTGVHLFDLVRHLTGQEFTEIDSRQRQVLNPTLEDQFLARATLADGTWVDLEVGKFTRSVSCLLEAVGETGQLLADYRHGGVTLIREGERERRETGPAPPTLPALLRDWLRVLDREIPPPVTVADGLRTLEVVEACYLSHRERRPVRIAEL
jgi:predicted dehydrogenase